MLCVAGSWEPSLEREALLARQREWEVGTEAVTRHPRAHLPAQSERLINTFSLEILPSASVDHHAVTILTYSVFTEAHTPDGPDRLMNLPKQEQGTGPRSIQFVFSFAVGLPREHTPTPSPHVGVLRLSGILAA